MAERLTPEQIADVLAKHQAWLRGLDEGVEANLTRANLTGADLYRADLTRANLAGANLTGADLYSANLYRANLYRANLTRADLTTANLTGADLTRADLTGADLTGANLAGADLYRANLYRADLTGANLSGADLTGANPTRAKLFDGWAVNDYRDLLWIGPLGSRNDYLMINLPTLRLKAGCFEGTVDDFLKKVSETHGDNVYGREYAATVAYLRALVEARNG